MNTGVKILLSIVLIILASVVLTGIREAGGVGFIGSLLFLEFFSLDLEQSGERRSNT